MRNGSSALPTMVALAGCGAVSITVVQHANHDAVASNFSLPSPTGTVTLDDALAGGPVLLVFYRGFW